MAKKKSLRGPKQPAHQAQPPEGKAPRAAESPSSNDAKVIAWHLRTIDQHGPYGWGKIEKTTLWASVLSKVTSLESTTWADLMNNGSHPIPVKDLCQAARSRLKKIKQDDVDELFSLRLTGKQRIWGIRDQNILKVLWWDPEHEVCPSAKSHT